MKTIWMMGLALGLAFAAPAQAAPSKDQCQKVGLFVATTNLNAMLAGLKGPDYDSTDDLAEFDRDKVAAIKAVAGAPGYEAALKEYVVAARDYLNNIAAKSGESRIVYQARTSVLTSGFEQAQERVELEKELACGG